MNVYRHTQKARYVLWIILTACVLTGAVVAQGRWEMSGLIVVLLAAGRVFSSLRIEVAGGELRWSFGGGWIRKRVALAEVQGAEAVRTNWLDGWGIHYTRHGWLYNVAGFDAVKLTLKSGRRIALGTDEPAALLGALAASGVQATGTGGKG